MIAYYHFDGDAKDASGHGNDGAVLSASDVSYSAGKIGDALILGGTDKYVNVPNRQLLSFYNTDFSISVWIEKVTLSSKETYRIVNKLQKAPIGATFKGYNLDITDNKLRFQICDGTTSPNLDGCYSVTTSDLSSLSGIFNNIISMRNSTGLYIFVNGNMVASSLGNFNTGLNSGTDFVIGRPSTFTADSSFTGKIDELRIYNRALTADEIKLLAK